MDIFEEASAIAARQWRHHRLAIMQRYRKALFEADFEMIEAVFQETEGDEQLRAMIALYHKLYRRLSKEE